MKNVSIKKIPRVLHFYFKKLTFNPILLIQKKINRNTNFSKINYKNVSVLFFYLLEIIYCLILLKKIKIILKKMVYSILLGLKVIKKTKRKFV